MGRKPRQTTLTLYIVPASAMLGELKRVRTSRYHQIARVADEIVV